MAMATRLSKAAPVSSCSGMSSNMKQYLEGLSAWHDMNGSMTPAINLHMDVHSARHDVEVVIHNHPAWGSVWSAVKRTQPIYDQTSALVDTDPVIYDEYGGTVEDGALGRAAASSLGQEKWALLASVATQTGQRTDANGFPFLWEAMAREEIRQDPSVLL